jgi:hypothetical protein
VPIPRRAKPSAIVSCHNVVLACGHQVSDGIGVVLTPDALAAPIECPFGCGPQKWIPWPTGPETKRLRGRTQPIQPMRGRWPAKAAAGVVVACAIVLLLGTCLLVLVE